MASSVFVNFDKGKGLMPDHSKPLRELIVNWAITIQRNFSQYWNISSQENAFQNGACWHTRGSWIFLRYDSHSYSHILVFFREYKNILPKFIIIFILCVIWITLPSVTFEKNPIILKSNLKPLPRPMLIYYQYVPMTFIRGQFYYQLSISKFNLKLPYCETTQQWPLLVIWTNFNTSMDK